VLCENFFQLCLGGFLTQRSVLKTNIIQIHFLLKRKNIFQKPHCCSNFFEVQTSYTNRLIVLFQKNCPTRKVCVDLIEKNDHIWSLFVKLKITLPSPFLSKR
jgi:hypothetical protein